MTIEHQECNICLCEWNPEDIITETKCKGRHIFHEICIQEWIKNHKNCPVCR